MRTAILAGFALAGLAAPAAMADDDDNARYFQVPQQTAIDIAASAGLYELEEIEADDGAWEIEGHTIDGCEIELEVNGRTGRIESREIDDCSGRGDDDWDDDRDDDDWDDDDRGDWEED